MAQIIEVKLGEFRPIFPFLLDDVGCKRDDYVILEVDRGVEYGRVVSDTHAVCKPKAETQPGKILRAANSEDLNQIERNKAKAKEALNICTKKVAELKLDMQVVQCEYSFDMSKVVFFFTSEGRIDFRGLVKDLARIFKIRIELKQIGVRDKAKIVGGFGVCGRELCCTSFLRDFHPLSIKMSKEQGLPLNPTRISGLCGRIKCCMAYEFSVYKEYVRDLPRIGERITTAQGKGKVIDINILRRYVKVDLGEGNITKIVFAQKEEE